MLSKNNSRMNEHDKRQQNKGKVKNKNLIVKMFSVKLWPWSNCHLSKDVWRNTKCRMFCTNIKCPLWNSKCDHTALIRIKTNQVCTLQWHRQVSRMISQMQSSLTSYFASPPHTACFKVHIQKKKTVKKKTMIIVHEQG